MRSTASRTILSVTDAAKDVVGEQNVLQPGQCIEFKLEERSDQKRFEFRVEEPMVVHACWFDGIGPGETAMATWIGTRLELEV